LIIVPGIAFDKQGYRIGHGKGYYDRLLKNVSILKIGFAFNLQILEKIPSEKHDIKINKIITESEIMSCIQ
jgi:5-formyltetrahydrofolate cyclo-ligase